MSGEGERTCTKWAIMPTDEDRRKAASSLRECRGGWSSGECYYAIIAAAKLPDTSRDDGGRALYSLLADLIEPSCDRAALLEIADTMDDEGSRVEAQLRKEGVLKDKWAGYATYIRKACGVGDA